jgi:hypothetical protein
VPETLLAKVIVSPELSCDEPTVAGAERRRGQPADHHRRRRAGAPSRLPAGRVLMARSLLGTGVPPGRRRGSEP